MGLPARAASMVAEAQPTNTSAAAIGKIARMFHPRGKKESDSSTSTGDDQRHLAVHRWRVKVRRGKETKWSDSSDSALRAALRP
ncbi:hypothetical protein GCM10011247_29170 [Pseudomonas plecoglossicida]|nr:hypothetical protein GCM10011247_29170 [Pseudomonas plecoglossicida]